MDKPMPGSIIYTNNPPVEIKGLMTLRDYFAAHVLMGMYAGDYGYDRKIRAEVAYEMADAMLEARMNRK